MTSAAADGLSQGNLRHMPPNDDLNWNQCIQTLQIGIIIGANRASFPVMWINADTGMIQKG